MHLAVLVLCVNTKFPAVFMESPRPVYRFSGVLCVCVCVCVYNLFSK
jgi:hypothetical protein